jgi:hypothetical protein
MGYARFRVRINQSINCVYNECLSGKVLYKECPLLEYPSDKDTRLLSAREMAPYSSTVRRLSP